MAAKRVIQVIEDVADEVEAAICGHCWPSGWPHLAQSASCEHGEFVRDVPADPEPPVPGATDASAATAETAPPAAAPEPAAPDPADTPAAG